MTHRTGSPHSFVRSALAAAVGATLLVPLLSACQWPGGPGVDQLNALRGPTRDLTVELREGTNMAAAPSPDGKRIVFSAQGALWVMPSAGGRAVRITDYRLEPTAPAWSPDGKRIAFQNYAPEGNFHIWTISPEGRDAAEITSGPYDDREPAWLPDGSGLVFSSDRGGDGQYKIWSVALGRAAPGRAAPVQLTTGPGAESNPAVSPDGWRLAYVDGANVVTAPILGGAPTLVAPGTAPAWTPDGGALVYQNAARQLVVGTTQVSSDEDIFPFPVRFLPDGRFLYTSDGKIRTRDAAGAGRADIDFRADLALRRPLLGKPKGRGFDNAGPRKVAGFSAPALSPDGRSIAFVALNDVWTMRIGEEPVGLTDDRDRDANPQWTADGRAVYFSSERGNAGQLAVDQVDLASGTRTRLAAIPGRSMVTPKLSPDGGRIAYTTLSGQLEIWDRATNTPELIIASNSTQVSTPQWTPDGRRILLVDNERINNRFREGYNKLRVIDLASRTATFYPVAAAPRQIAERDEGAAALAPDGSQVAFIMDSRLHVMPLGADGAPAGPARQVGDDIADLPAWGGDSRTILYKSAERVRTVRADGSDTREIPVRLEWRQDVPQGRTVIHAGALWDGVGSDLRHDVDIVVDGNRIVSVAPHGAHAPGARVVDAGGLTVMPGLIETHLHPLTLYQGGQFGQIAQLMLSYGVTTAQSVAGPLHQSVELREALDAGRLVGPRLFVSPPLWEGNRLFYSFARTLRTPQVAQLEIDKAKRMDADFLKSYVRAPIPVMERIAQGALDLGVPSGTHMVQPGAATGLLGTTHLSATQRMGYGWSKSLARLVTYQDAADVYGKGGFHLIDTLFSSSALAGLDPGIASDPRFILVPPNFVAGLRNATPPTAAQIATIVNDATQQAKVKAAGALVANGTDSPLVVPGISLHLNLRGAALVQGNLAALQSATRDAAKIALVDDDLGTGWRVPFLASAILVAVGLYVRLKITETPDFQKVLDRGERVKVPVVAVLRDHGGPLVLGTLMALSTFVLFYLMTVFALSWGTTALGFSRTDFLFMQLGAVVFFGLTIPPSALIADRFGRRAAMIAVTLGITLFGLTFGQLFVSGHMGTVMLFMIIGLGLMGLTYGPLGTLLSELFPPAVRYTGASLTFNLAGILGASLAPYIATKLATEYGIASVGWYLSGAALLSLVALVLTTGKAREHVREKAVAE